MRPSVPDWNCKRFGQVRMQTAWPSGQGLWPCSVRRCLAALILALLMRGSRGAHAKRASRGPKLLAVVEAFA